MPLETSVPTVSTLTPQAGVSLTAIWRGATTIIVSAVVLSKSFRLDQGFDLYSEPAKSARPTRHYDSRPAEEVVDDALAWLERRDPSRPFFCWLHFFDPHKPLEPPPEFLEQAGGNPYLGEVARMDAAIGRFLGLDERILSRQPFPGPGLAVRIAGEVTPERLHLLREADSIVTTEIEAAGANAGLWQYFAVLVPVLSVGVMGDARTYENACALRVVESVDGMTADWAYLDRELLRTISNRIINEVRGLNRVVLDISSKPPATIEWE